jgi:hypothetical protein
MSQTLGFPNTIYQYLGKKSCWASYKHKKDTTWYRYIVHVTVLQYSTWHQLAHRPKLQTCI